MILLHAMEAPYDLPGIDIHKGDTMYHLLSDVPGTAGTAELLAFVRRCGGQDSWLQAAGTYREHFDIFGEWAERARELGARPADGHDVAAVLAAKRAAAAQQPPAVPALTSRQMRGLDRFLTSEFHISTAQRMDLGALRIADLARMLLGGAMQTIPIAVLAGPGRTGAMGLIAARHLAHAGAQVTVWLPHPHAMLHREIAEPLAALHDAGIAVTHSIPTADELASCALVVDALLGAGTFGAPRAEMAASIAAANAAEAPILAVELPSGLDPNDIGAYAPCMHARATLALGLPLRALTLADAAAFTGDLWLGDVGIPPRAPKRVGARVADVFAAAPLVRLAALPLAGDALASDVRGLRVMASD